jgi:hypothetical protein
VKVIAPASHKAACLFAQCTAEGNEVESKSQTAHMPGPDFDVEALIRGVLIGLATAFIGSAVVSIVTGLRRPPPPRRVILLAGAGVALLIAVAVYYGWPTVVNVPRLDGLSQAQAEEKLRKGRLIANAQPQHGENTEPGRVIANSQDPVAGLPVRPHTIVSFGVSQRLTRDQARPGTDPANRPAVGLFSPRSDQPLLCSRGPGRIGRCTVSGGSAGADGPDWRLILWLRPAAPASDVPGWYLQRPPGNGLTRVDSDGTWSGTVQVGNPAYPPQDGWRVDIAISATRRELADRMMDAGDIVVRDSPEGAVVAVATSVELRFK